MAIPEDGSFDPVAMTLITRAKVLLARQFPLIAIDVDLLRDIRYPLLSPVATRPLTLSLLATPPASPLSFLEVPRPSLELVLESPTILLSVDPVLLRVDASPSPVLES